MTNRQQKIVRICNRVMFCAVCALGYFLPISGALVEWGFGISLLSYLVKRSTLYKAKIDQEFKQATLPLQDQIVRKIHIMGQAFVPVPSVVNIPLAVYAGIIFLSMGTSYYPFLSLQAFVFKFLEEIFIAFLVLEALSSRKRIKIFLSILLISITLVTINGFVQYGTGTGFLRGRILKMGRLVSSFTSGNDFAVYCVTVLPVLFALSVLQGFRPSISGKQEFFSSKWFRLAAGALFTGVLGCLGLSYSRAGWLAMALALIFVIGKNKRLWTYFLLGLMAFAIIFIPKMVHERGMNIDYDIKNVFMNVSSRNQTWANAGLIILDHPALGVGLNNYSAVSQNYDFIHSEYPHNCYLQIAAETGILSLVVFCWFLYVLFKDAWKGLEMISEDRFLYCLQRGVIAGLGAFLFQSAFDTFFYSTQLSALMWLFIGLILAIANVAVWHRSLPLEEELTKG